MLQGLTRFFLETIVQDHKKLSTGALTMEHVRTRHCSVIVILANFLDSRYICNKSY